MSAAAEYDVIFSAGRPEFRKRSSRVFSPSRRLTNSWSSTSGRLIRMKQTQRAKDYPTIAELARLLPPESELELTTDPDRILELSSQIGAESKRVPVEEARSGNNREEVVVALAWELDQFQQLDRKRLDRYQRASRGYLQAFQRAGLSKLPLMQAHQKCCKLALRLLPREIDLPEEDNADAQ